MQQFPVSTLSKTFKNWSFSQKRGNRLQISAQGSKHVEEIPGLLRALYELIDESKFRITLEHDEAPSIVVEERPLKKYNRLYTSGCFDIFHFGHLNIFEKSKALCNHLIVGVSTDELIEREKGRSPIIPFEERFRVIEAVSYVDEVIPQVDKDKQKIVDQYAIDAISVGDDWRGKYPKVSCQMEYFPYTKSISSTILKDTLQLTVNR